MALVLENSFEGGTSGTAISAVNSGAASGNAFDSVAGTAPQFSNAHAMHGSLAMAMQGTGRVVWGASITGSPTTLYGRLYLFFTATPTVQTIPFRTFTPTSTTVALTAVRLASTGKLTNIVKAGTAVLSTNTLAINTWYRIEWKAVAVVSGNCTLDCIIYVGDSLTPLETMGQATAAGVSTDTSINTADSGSTNAVTANVLFHDDLQVNDRGFPGPYVVARRGIYRTSMGLLARPPVPAATRLPRVAWR